tara:strand:- start:1538 stop:2275 length:738 start_codon:yes stop_codon:yes gene_type:complete
MATTTAQITLTSSDLLTDALSLNSSTSLNQAGGSTGIINTTGLARKKISFAGSGVIDSVVLYRGDDYTADKANKIYLKNTSTDDTEYFEIMITGDGGTAGGGVTELGRLYAGDWAFFPWNATGGTKETFIATIANTWAAGDTWEFDGVRIVAANSTAADIAAQIDAANFPNWVTSRSTAAVTFVARYALDAGTVATATADIVVDTAGDGTSAVSSSTLGTKSLSDIYIKPSVHTGMTLEHMLFYE